MKAWGLFLMLVLWAAPPLRAQNLEPADVHLTLDSALTLARAVAASAFPDLSKYLLYSVKPRVFKNDPPGLHWQVEWQERAFPHRKWLVVRVYMDGHSITERLE